MRIFDKCQQIQVFLKNYFIVMKLSFLKKIISGKWIGASDVDTNAISIDTRTLKPGDVFFAIRGDARDGHDFMVDAEKAGAAAVVVSRDVQTTLPKILVSDTRHALFDLARFYRENTSIPVVAITGSCGKTTTRALLENILKQVGSVLASEKSFNNDLGVPLTLSKLKPDHQFAVLELGANHLGEIAALTKLVRPTIAVITMAAPVHLEGFGSVDNIARAKGEIFDGLSDDGIAVINQDDAFAPTWKTHNQHRRVITFGIQNKADVMARNIICDEKSVVSFTLQLSHQSVQVVLPILGMHNVNNALAAAAVAYGLGIPIGKVKAGLETALPVERRLNEKKGFRGATIIDDSYNANPTSVRAAIEILTRRPGKSFLVLGDMLELGKEADQIHEQIGRFAFTRGVQHLFCYGKLSAHAATGFGQRAKHFDHQDTLIQSLKNDLSHDAIVLVKGSHGMNMNHIVSALTEN